MNRTKRIDARLVWIAAMLALIPGCLFSPDKTKPKTGGDEIYQLRTTIDGVMNNLMVSYEKREIDRYSELFDQAGFMFVFDPTDVQTDPDIPPNWDWNEEQNSTRNMFEAELVERIQIDFVRGAPTDPSESDRGERPFPSGTKKVTVTEVELSVDTRDPAGGENITYKVTGDQAIFFLVQDSVETQEGLPVWKIFEWRDKKIGDEGRPAPVAS